jgi:hypothetical protein
MENSKTASFVITRSGRIKWLHVPEGFPRLTARKLERIRRATIRSHDPTRYMVVATIGGIRTLYYRAEDSCFGSHISAATLFKDRSVAEAVRKALRGDRMRRGYKVLKVRKTKSGVRLVKKLDPKK